MKKILDTLEILLMGDQASTIFTRQKHGLIAYEEYNDKIIVKIKHGNEMIVYMKRAIRLYKCSFTEKED